MGRGRPALDYRKPIKTTKKQRRNMSKTRTLQLLARVAKIDFRPLNDANINELADRIACFCREKKLSHYFRDAITKLVERAGGVVSAKVYAEDYAHVQDQIFKLLSYAFRNQNHFTHQWNKYDDLVGHLLSILPDMSRVVIFFLYLSPYATFNPLYRAVHLTLDEHYSLAQIELDFRSINVTSEVNFGRCLHILLTLALERRLPPWFYNYYYSAKAHYNAHTHMPTNQALNTVMTKLTTKCEESEQLRREIEQIKKSNHQQTNTIKSLSIKNGKLRHENEQLKDQLKGILDKKRKEEKIAYF